MFLKFIRKKFRNYYKIYWCLVFLRIFLVFLPQTGYIHPDEFFQSIEILVGNFFEVEANKPWEFTTTFPIRSMTLPYIILGLSYKILKCVNIITNVLFHRNIITPYSLLMFPRLIMCLLSFIVDWSVYKICVNNNEKYKFRLLILASSYVMLVFGTRTFSNTFELFLFALLLYYVADSMTVSNIVVRQQEYLNKRYSKCKTHVDKAKIHKLRLYLTSHSLRNCIQISTITVVGFFNRPTFLAFAFLPVFFWLYRGIGFKSVMSMHFHLRMLMLLICAIPTILFYIIADSIYYGYLSVAEVEFLTVAIDNFLFTPLNFLKYNLDSNNLAHHGVHPRYLHILVNVPLLFNILGLVAFVEISNLCMRLMRQKYHLLPTVRSIKGLMTASLVAPIVLLSIFPHQEPRFLIPAIIPLVYLYGHVVLQEPDSSLVKMTKEALTLDYMERKLKAVNYTYMKLWLFFNITCLLFFGFIHQGGVFFATSHLANEMKQKPLSTNFHIYSSHIYSIPESLFLQRSTEKIYYRGKSKFNVNKRVLLHEEGSKDLSFVLQKIHASLHASTFVQKSDQNITYLVLPSSLKQNLEFLILNDDINLKLQDCVTFYPHLSTEAFPNFNLLIDQIFNFKYHRLTDFIHNMLMFMKSFGLTVCEVVYH